MVIWPKEPEAEAAVAPTLLRDQARSRSLKVGLFVLEFCTPGIGHILRSAGCDFAIADMEHSGFDVGIVKAMVRYMEAARIPLVVRVPSCARRLGR